MIFLLFSNLNSRMSKNMHIWRHKFCNAKMGVGPTFTWPNEPWWRVTRYYHDIGCYWILLWFDQISPYPLTAGCGQIDPVRCHQRSFSNFQFPDAAHDDHTAQLLVTRLYSFCLVTLSMFWLTLPKETCTRYKDDILIHHYLFNQCPLSRQPTIGRSSATSRWRWTLRSPRTSVWRL